MLPFFKNRRIALPPPEKPRFRPWRRAGRAYYDLTPPSEVSEPEPHSQEPRSPEPHSPDPHIPAPDPRPAGSLGADSLGADEERDPLVAVVGVGYVGEHLVSAFSRRYRVLGFDISAARVESLRQRFAGEPRVGFTAAARDLAGAAHFLIAVPTLLRPDDGSVDASFLQAAVAAVSRAARRGAVVVIESSVAVGMTRALLGPVAAERGLFAGMSPERVDPGRAEPPVRAIPKVVSGLDDAVPGSAARIAELYSAVFDRVVPVSRPEVAEMTKLYENCQRMVGIAYANEMADACLAHGIDPFEVCDAAATKPFGYMAFRPGVGVGGHCIPINPIYLLANNDFPLLEAATERMRRRPALLAQRAVDSLSDGSHPRSHPRSHPSPTPRPRVLVVGVGFKPGQAQLANSPGLELARSLVLTGRIDVAWIDPLVAQEAVPQIARLDVGAWTPASLDRCFDLIIVAQRQHGLDFSVLDKLQRVRVDMWC